MLSSCYIDINIFHNSSCCLCQILWEQFKLLDNFFIDISKSCCHIILSVKYLSHLFPKIFCVYIFFQFSSLILDKPLHVFLDSIEIMFQLCYEASQYTSFTSIILVFTKFLILLYLSYSLFILILL